jgi:hypothetical protein
VLGAYSSGPKENGMSYETREKKGGAEFLLALSGRIDTSTRIAGI